MCYNLTLWDSPMCLSINDVVLKVHWKGKWTWTMQRLPLHSGISVLTSKFIFMLSLPFCSLLTFWWGNGVKGPKMFLFWCLMPKGEKLRPKQMDQLPLCEFWIFLKTIELELLNCSKYSYCKIWSLVRVNFDYGKKGEFLVLDQFFIGISLDLPKQVCLT
jgi:hypothetical protein